MTGGRLNTIDDLKDAARGRNDLIDKTLTQALYNRGGKFAKFSDMIARIKALFSNPSERGRDGSSNAVRRGKSLYNVVAAITGQNPEDIAINRLERREQRRENLDAQAAAPQSGPVAPTGDQSPPRVA